MTVAKLRLGDLEKAERQTAESQSNALQGKMTFGAEMARNRDGLNWRSENSDRLKKVSIVD